MSRTRVSLLMMATAAITAAVLFSLPDTPVPVVRTAVIEKGDLVQSTFLSGVVGYLNEQPCVSPKTGSIEKVCAAAGQPVQKGELLFQLDTVLEEETLAACMQANSSRPGLGDAVSAVLPDGQLRMRQIETEARAGIAASRIRAGTDGVMQAVYVQTGAYVKQGDILGWMRGNEKCVQATGRMERLADARTGTAAVLSDGSLLALEQIGAPSADGIQQLTFLPSEEDALSAYEPGDHVTVELWCSAETDLTLAPVEAFGTDGGMWLLQDGRAQYVKTDTAKRNTAWVAVPGEFAGMRVILHPDAHTLTPGCAVKDVGAE